MQKAARILTISKPYVSAAFRHKLHLMQENSEFEVGLLCPPAWGAQKFESQPDQDQKLWIKTLPILFNGKNHFHVYKHIKQAIISFKPDVINLEEEHYSAVTWQVARVAQKLKTPYVFYTWQNIYKSYPPPFSNIERYIFKTSAAGIAGNQEAKDILRKKGYQSPIFTIPQMGVDERNFPPGSSADKHALRQRLGMALEKFTIVFAGRLVAEKGVDTLLTAAARCQQRQSLAIIILGSGPAELSLRQLAKDLNLLDQVSFRSSVPSYEVTSYFRAMDALALPSLTRPNWKEQFGRVLTEAMACKALVIGSSSGEIPVVIDNAGYVFPEGDADKLAQIIDHCIASPEKTAALQDLGYQRVHSHFTNKKIAEQFNEVFRLVMAKAR